MQVIIIIIKVIDEMNGNMNSSMAAVAVASIMNDAATGSNNSTAEKPILGCEYDNGSTYAAGSFFIMLFLFFCCKILHVTIFQRLGQPRIITELTVGLILGNLDFMTDLLNIVNQLFNSFAELGMSCYLLVLGLEMDPYVLIQKPTPHVIVAYIEILTSFVVASIITPILKLSMQEDSVGFILSLSLTLAGASSHVITRLVTDLKISKSDMGTLVIGAGMQTDMISMILIATSFVFHPTDTKQAVPLIEGVIVMVMLTTMIILLAKVVFPKLVRWMNDRNPEGKPMKGSDMVVFVATVAFICSTGSIIAGYSPPLTSFLVGLAFPRRGRITKMVAGKINQLLSFIFFPIFFFWAGSLASFSQLTFLTDKFIGIKLFFLYGMVIFGKVSGALLSARLLGFKAPVAIAMGLFLNVKGHFHIFVAAYALHDANLINTGSYIVLVFFAILSIALVPWLVKIIILLYAKKQSTFKRMAVQFVDPNGDHLRMLLCIHGPQNVPTMINIIEVSRGNTDPGISVYVTDMIEINDCNSMLLLPDHHHHHQHSSSSDGDGSSTGVTMADESVVDMREEITNAILTYVEKSGKGILIHRLLAISSFANMHQDLYNLAEAVQASLLILPFHSNQMKDGRMDNVHHHGFRHVNRKVLRQAPCSVGILVDRGLGSINGRSLSSSSPTVTLHVAVVFLGGKDDREALAYATRISQHPGINLTAIRFLQDNNTEKASCRAKNKPLAVREKEEQELRLDDEYFAKFYEKNVAHRKVGYVEKHVVNAKEMISTLKELEAQYALFIVGRAGRVNSILTTRMNDWEECPDLGPIGEILADSDFSTTASVLVIQQHSLDGLENEFTVMTF